MRLSDSEWLAQQIEDLTDEMEIIRPSEWAEARRYLPPSVTSLPGYYRYDVAPFLKEIVDCLSIDNPTREISIQKGVQIGGTVGILENAIGYYIDHVRTAPIMLVTADAELAKLRMESYITPMIEHSGLGGLIKSADPTNNRKTGKTDKKIEWLGGGFLIPFGARNANKLRSISIQILLRDEIDGWPMKIGNDGDPIKLSADRTAAYESSRKIVDLSTPLIKRQSQIEKRFLLGDQRYYYVHCLNCNAPQVLRFRRVNPDTGEITGLVWETEGERLIPESVRYLCKECGHPHSNDDKTRLLAESNGAQWIPTAEPSTPYHRSYHISALYSPVGMQTWGTCVQKWLEAWDVKENRPRDMEQLQVFYNNVLGESFELQGEKLRFTQVSAHRRDYRYGEIPNMFAKQVAGSEILLLTAAVDVHKENLKVAVMGWTRDRRVFVVDYQTFEGDTEQLDNKDTWGALRTLLEQKQYEADDGKSYGIQLTLIDAGYRTDQVYEFCSEYVAGVYPVKGRDDLPKNAVARHFSEFRTPQGTNAYHILVDLYKDRWSASLRRHWDRQNVQPVGHFNAPVNATDAQLKELTAETKREKIEKTTGKRVGWEWHRPSGAANELWDLLVYNNAALDLICWNLCRGQWELDSMDWPLFWNHLEKDRPFFSA